MQVTYQSDGVHLDLVELIRHGADIVRLVSSAANQRSGGPGVPSSTTSKSATFNRCADLETSQPIGLTNEDASLELFPVSPSSNASGGDSDRAAAFPPSVELTLTTNEPEGLVLHALVGSDLVFAVELFEGLQKLSNVY